MWYVEVLVADATYHKNEPLTYSVDKELARGGIVVVPLRHKQVLGVVMRTVPKPSFVAKPVIATPSLSPLSNVLLELLEWMRQYYPAPLGMVVQLFLPSQLPKRPYDNNASVAHKPQQLPPLTVDQKKALAGIGSNGVHLLHGNTGTGKTRVYIELAKRSFKMGRSAIILTPEIGLTTQLAQTFTTTFADRIVVLHSGLSEATRQRIWQWLLQQTQPVIVIGARSALFAPLKDIGVIIVDESHETSYKQDQAPHYQTSTVAAKLAELHNATVVLGSATPLVRDYYVAKAKGRPILRMTELATNHGAEPQIEIVDLKDRTHFKRSPYLSAPLLDAINTSLGQKTQTLLFLNRRGTARVVFCQGCGWQATCPHCDLALVYHGDHHIMRCHSCNHKTTALHNCPSCKSSDIIYKSIGTKAITEEVHRLFPTARVMRFDTDNKKAERLDTQYESVRSGQVDIIVGTQTLAKGLDLPKLSLVGVIMADTGLSFPDFTAQERTYQLLSQVVGRIGRGHVQGKAIIQTYSPESPVMLSVRTKDWGDFYNRELAERRNFVFPPFCHLLKLSCKRASAASAQKTSEDLVQKIRSNRYNGLTVEGPAPSFHEKIENKFVWQIVVKAKRREDLLAIIKSLPSGWSYDIDPTNLL